MTSTIGVALEVRDYPCGIGQGVATMELCHSAVEWDEAIQKLGGSIHQSWAWGEFKRRTQGWDPFRVLVKHGEGVRAAIQILERRIPFLPLRVFCAPGGIACPSQDDALLTELVAWLRVFIRERRGILLRMDSCRLDSDSEYKVALCRAGLRQLADRWGVWGVPGRVTMALDITACEEVLLSKMHQKHRQHIGRASRLGITIEVSRDPNSVEEFYSCLTGSSARRDFHVYALDYYAEAFRSLSLGCRPAILLARLENRPVSALFCAMFGETCYALFSGFDPEFSRLHSMEALHWRAIQLAKDAGCRVYDLLHLPLVDIPHEGEPGYGLYNFKRGLGAEWRYSAGYFDLCPNPLLYQAFRFTERKLGPLAYEVAAKTDSLLQRFATRAANPANVATGGGGTQPQWTHAASTVGGAAPRL